MGEKGKRMTMEQARKMRDGVLKGDSAIAAAWKELIDSEPATGPADEASAQTDERGQVVLDMKDEGAHRLAFMRRTSEQF